MSVLHLFQVSYVQPTMSPPRPGDPQQGRNGGPNIFLGIPCVAASGANPLPVPIQPNPPHFLLKIGHNLSYSSPYLTVLYDTAAGMEGVGKFYLVDKIGKKNSRVRLCSVYLQEVQHHQYVRHSW